MKKDGELHFCEDNDSCEDIKQFLIDKNKDWVDFKRNINIKDYNDSLETIIVTCIDSRVPVEKIFNLQPGEALVIRNAGNIITEDAIRSIMVGIYEIHAKYIIILGHTRCGMAMKNNTEELRHMYDSLSDDFKADHGITNIDSMIEWFGFFENGKWEENAIQNAKKLEKIFSKYFSPKNKSDNSDKKYADRPEVLTALYNLDTGEIKFIEH